MIHNLLSGLVDKFMHTGLRQHPNDWRSFIESQPIANPLDEIELAE